MKLVVGLGNPGPDYTRHRHNVGFMALDALAERLKLRFNQKRARSELAQGEAEGQRVALAKPQTYMNLSGQAVRQLTAELGVKPQDLLVVYDDVDLPLGTLRLRRHGSAGTHNGMRSIVEELGTQGFPRLRLGIGRPGQGMALRDFVLEPFGEEERQAVREMLDDAVETMVSVIQYGAVEAMTRYRR